jgi:hypothetical protein
MPDQLKDMETVGTEKGEQAVVAIQALMTAMLSEGAIKAASDAAMEEAGGMGLHAAAREDAAKAICRCAGKTLLAAIDIALSGKDHQVEAITPKEASALLACSQGRAHEGTPFFSGQAKLEAIANDG